MDTRDALRIANPLSRRLPEDVLDELERDAFLREFENDEVVIQAKDLSDTVFAVVEGCVRASRLNASGYRAAWDIRPGHWSWIGIAPMALGTPFGFDLEAAASGATTVNIPRLRFRELVDRGGDYADIAIGAVSRASYTVGAQVEMLSATTTGGRLARFLLQRSDKKGWADLGMHRQDIAVVMGVTPESLSRTIARWERAGLTRFNGPRMQILNRRTVEALARS